MLAVVCIELGPFGRVGGLPVGWGLLKSTREDSLEASIMDDCMAVEVGQRLECEGISRSRVPRQVKSECAPDSAVKCWTS